MIRRRQQLFVGFLALVLLFLDLPGFGQEGEKDFCMPGFSPLYGPPPIQFRGNRIVSVVFRTAPEVLQKLVPKPLLANPFGVMFAYVGRLAIKGPVGGSLEYLEAGLGVPAFFNGLPGNYAVCLYLNKAMPIVGGREVWGWPKKDAEMTFLEKDGTITGRVERLGAVLLELSAKLDKKADPASAQPELPWFLLKIIPSVKRDAPPDVRQLVAVRNSGVRTGELWGCTASLKLNSGAEDALGDIPVGEIVAAQFSVGDFTMDFGEVLHDYLARK